MKKKVSLNAMLHNEKFIIIFSLLAAIAVWGFVFYGPGSEITRTFKDVPIAVELTNGYALEQNLRILGDKEYTAQVTVSGPTSVVSNLSKDDITLTADTGDVTSPGEREVNVRFSQSNNQYTVMDVSVKKITISCDYWVKATFPVQTDVSKIKVTDKTKYRLGTALAESESFTDGSITLEGPQSQMSQVASLVAVVEEEKTIEDVQVFAAALKARDASGKDVDISDCLFYENEEAEEPLAAVSVNVTVPVEVYRKVEFQYALEHVPAYYEKQKDFFTLSPSYIEFWGSPKAVEEFAAQIGNLGSFDFDNIKPTDTERVIPLNVPEGITVLGEVKEVKASLKLGNVTSRSMNLDLTSSNIQVENKPDNWTLTSHQSQLTGIQLCGPQSTLNRIREKDLQVTITLPDNATTNVGRYPARVTVKDRENVWVYYGDGDQSGIEIWVTAEIR